MNAFASLLERPALILNKRWVPIRTSTAREAIGLVASGSARIIDPQTYEVHDLDSWHAVSEAREIFEGSRIRSMRLSLVPPEVVVLTEYEGLGARAVVFSRSNLFKRDRYTCQYCGARPNTSEMTIDHILPRSRGGLSSWENCVLSCFDCNKRKRDRTPDESGMRLRKSPVRPSWAALSALSHRVKCASWRNFLSQAYWETELEP
jgi:5-methylcytosine-specific restriction endonuclease McrA